MEPEKAQDAQVILANTRLRVADESDAASLEIGYTPGIIVNALRRDRARGH